MRARDAEKLMADILTKADNLAESKNVISKADLVGFQRSQPIYAKKLKKSRELRNKRSLLGLILLKINARLSEMMQNFIRYLGGC